MIAAGGEIPSQCRGAWRSLERGRIARQLSAVAALLPLLLSAPADALEWSATPRLESRLEHNTNRLLSHLPHEAVTGTLLTASSDLRVRAPTWEIGSEPWLRVQRYADQEGLDSEAWRLDLDGRYRTPRSTWRFDSRLLRDESLDDETIEDLVDAERRRRDQLELSASWEYATSERGLFSLELSHLERRYHSEQVTNDSYRVSDLSLSMRYLLTPRASTTLSLGVNALERLELEDRTDTLRLLLTGSYQWTPQWDVAATLGYRDVSREVEVVQTVALVDDNGDLIDFLTQEERVDESDGGEIFAISSLFKQARWKLSTALIRDVRASGFGTAVEESRGVIELDYRIKERLRLALDLELERERQIGTGVSGQDQDRRSLSTTLDWDWQRHWRLSARLHHRHRELESGDTAESNALSVSLSWHGRKYTW